MMRNIAIPEHREIATITDFDTIRKLQDTAEIISKFNLTQEERNELVEKQGFLAIRAGELYSSIAPKRGREFVTQSNELTQKQDAEEGLQKSRKTISQWVRLSGVPRAYQKVTEYINRCDAKGEEATLTGLYKYLLNVHFQSGSDEWYTPQEVIKKVVKLFGTISLDPCSNSAGRPIIPAEHHFITETDGLKQDWFGKVYMNPPYGREIELWTMKLLTEYESQRVEEAIALVPSRTDTEWFYSFGAYPRCFVKGRLRFSEMENSAPFPSMIVYFGKRIPEFIQIFNDLGEVYQRITA